MVTPTGILTSLFTYGGFELTKKNKKEKAMGREQHKQAQRAKKLAKKEKKKVTIPAKYRKK